MVTGRIPDIDASQLLPVVDKLNEALGATRAKNPGYTISVTGLAAIAARNSADMIHKLNLGLTLEFLLVAMFIGLVFRSVVVMFSSILPGIFPVVLSGTVLWLMGQGLQFASVVALTVSFGLGLSATIHFLNRMRLEDQPGIGPGRGRRARDCAGRAGADPHVARAGVRAGGDGVLRPAVTAAVRMAERLLDAGGADRRSFDPAANVDVSHQSGAKVFQAGAAAEVGGGSRGYRRFIEIATSCIWLPGERIETFCWSPRVLIDEEGREGLALDTRVDPAAARRAADAGPAALRLVSFQLPLIWPLLILHLPREFELVAVARAGQRQPHGGAAAVGL